MEKTLLDSLISRFPTAKRETFRRMIRDGRVTINGKPPRTLKVDLSPTDRVEISDQPGRSERRPQLPYRIIHEDADLLVVVKPAGILTSTNPGESRPTLLAAIREYVTACDPRGRVGLIHRLDRDASGLLVFSKSDRAYHSLKTQFFHHTVERVYLAVTEGVPNPREGKIESRLEERADGTVYSTRGPGSSGQPAATRYEVLEAAGGRALVRVTLETGRKHQIRVHLAERGTPIVGDRMYGAKKDSARLMLVAAKLGLIHPKTGEPIVFELKGKTDVEL